MELSVSFGSHFSLKTCVAKQNFKLAMAPNQLLRPLVFFGFYRGFRRKNVSKKNSKELSLGVVLGDLKRGKASVIDLKSAVFSFLEYAWNQC